MAASAVARLMAVVVLPTPPFWLAIARMRTPDRADGGSRSVASGCGSDTAELADPEDAGIRGGTARDALHVHVPLRRGVRQFGLDAASLQKQTLAIRGQERSREAQESRQGGNGAGGDEGSRCELGRLDAAGMNMHAGAGDAGGLTEERRLPLVGLDQIEGHARWRARGPGRESRRRNQGRWRDWGRGASAGPVGGNRRCDGATGSPRSRDAIRLTVRFQRSRRLAKVSSAESVSRETSSEIERRFT